MRFQLRMAFRHHSSKVILLICTRSQDSAVVELNSSVFWAITRCEMGLNRRFGTTYRSSLQRTSRFGSAETSVSNRLVPRKNPEDGIIYLCVKYYTVLGRTYACMRLRLTFGAASGQGKSNFLFATGFGTHPVSYSVCTAGPSAG